MSLFYPFIIFRVPGRVYALGRHEYGRLGLGEEGATEQSEPKQVPALSDKKCVSINCGTCVSFAIAENGEMSLYLNVNEYNEYQISTCLL